MRTSIQSGSAPHRAALAAALVIAVGLSALPAAQAGQAAATRADATLARSVEDKKTRAVRSYTELGATLLAQKQYERAAQALATAYVLDQRPALLFQIAQAYRSAELNPEAMAVYQHLLRQDPQTPHRPEAEADLAALSALLEDSEFALSQRVRAYQDAGKRHFQAGQYSQSIGVYAALYAIRPLPTLLFNIAQGFRRSGRAEEAFLLYHRLLQEDPQNRLKRETLGYVADLRATLIKPPLYKRAWFWTVVAASAVAVGAGVGVGVTLGTGSPGIDKTIQPGTDIWHPVFGR